MSLFDSKSGLSRRADSETAGVGLKSGLKRGVVICSRVGVSEGDTSIHFLQRGKEIAIQALGDSYDSGCQEEFVGVILPFD